MNDFEYHTFPSRIIFGSGSVQKLPAEIRRINAARPLLLSTPRGSDLAVQLSENLQRSSIEVAGIFLNAKEHTPTSVTEETTVVLASKAADCVISIGGGSVIGLAKAISIRTGVSHISIPTTYSGSEMTPILGETHHGKKTTRSDPKILPVIVIYDPDLTISLPSPICNTSGVNAIAHAVEGLYASNTNPIIAMLALEGIRSLADSLPRIVQDPGSKAPREKALQLRNGPSSQTLPCPGGSFSLPHAETHTILLPHTLSYNAPAIPEQMFKLAEVLPESNGDAMQGLEALLQRLQVPRALKDVGMKESDIDRAADIAISNQYPNPRVLEPKWIRELIRRAWAGETAAANLQDIQSRRAPNTGHHLL